MTLLRKLAVGVSLVIACGLLWIFYSPAHEMRRIGWATVRIDDRF
jgi:hypothetical protein